MLTKMKEPLFLQVILRKVFFTVVCFTFIVEEKLFDIF